MKSIRSCAVLAVAMLVLTGPALAKDKDEHKSSGGFSASKPAAVAPAPKPAAPPPPPAAAAKPPSSGGFFGATQPKHESPKAETVAPAPSPAAKPPSSGNFTGATQPKPPAVSGGFMSGGAAKQDAAGPAVALPGASAYDAHVQRETAAKVSETRASPAFKAAVGDRTFTAQQIQDRREEYWRRMARDRDYYEPPRDSRTSYGSFSSGFLWGMVMNAAFAHNHADDPYYRQWRRDADERALTDARLRAQLDELDRKVAEMKEQPKDPNYVPKDVPPEVVWSDESLTNSTGGGHWLRWLLGIVIGLAVGGFVMTIFLNNRRRLA